MLDGVAGMAHFQCKQLLGDRYKRLAPIFPEGATFATDDVKHIQDMIVFASNVDIGETARRHRGEWL
jgi:hypothetical protein